MQISQVSNQYTVLRDVGAIPRKFVDFAEDRFKTGEIQNDADIDNPNRPTEATLYRKDGTPEQYSMADFRAEA